jgi:transcription termination/antitermination protein NusG
MDWYSLFVITGKEEYVSEWLKICFSDLEVATLIPKRRLIERKQGKKQQVLKKMFPGYVFMNTEMDLTKYYILKKIPNIIRILNSGEYYTRIPQEEMTCILHLLVGGDVVDLSKIYLVNSKVMVKSGPLEGMEGLITAVDRRKMRAKIVVPFMGLTREIDVGIEVLDKFSV